MANFTSNFNNDIGVHPSIGFKKATKVRVDVAQFGDGYAQRVASGLNTHNDEFQVSFINQDIATANKIQYFLEQAGQGADDGTGDKSRAGVDYFFWTPPDSSTQYKIVCSEWEIEYASPISRTISAKFMRVYDL